MINWKGGVGKSTLTLHLGVGIALRKRSNTKVLLVDLDPQCNLSFLALGVDRYIDEVYQNNHGTLKQIFDSYFSGTRCQTSSAIISAPISADPDHVWADVDVLLSHQELVLVDLRLARDRKSGSSHKEETSFELTKLSLIYNALMQVRNQYDYVILDCPPNINLVTQNALFASNKYLIPAIPDFLSTIGISLIKEKMENLNDDFMSMINYSSADVPYEQTEFTGIIFNMVDEYGGGPKDTHRKTIQSVSVQHPGKVFDHYLTDGDGISVASENNYTVYSFKHLPKSNQNAEKQSAYLNNIVDELLLRIP
ncbi:MAG: AAA family ATPase [Pseudomonadota bacterium]